MATNPFNVGDLIVCKKTAGPLSKKVGKLSVVIAVKNDGDTAETCSLTFRNQNGREFSGFWAHWFDRPVNKITGSMTYEDIYFVYGKLTLDWLE